MMGILRGLGLDTVGKARRATEKAREGLEAAERERVELGAKIEAAESAFDGGDDTAAEELGKLRLHRERCGRREASARAALDDAEKRERSAVLEAALAEAEKREELAAEREHLARAEVDTTIAAVLEVVTRCIAALANHGRAGEALAEAAADVEKARAALAEADPQLEAERGADRDARMAAELEEGARYGVTHQRAEVPARAAAASLRLAAMCAERVKAIVGHQKAAAEATGAHAMLPGFATVILERAGYDTRAEQERAADAPRMFERWGNLMSSGEDSRTYSKVMLPSGLWQINAEDVFHALWSSPPTEAHAALIALSQARQNAAPRGAGRPGPSFVIPFPGLPPVGQSEHAKPAA